MATKSLTARESIEAAFTGLGKRKLKASEIIAHVEANKKSAIVKVTIETQLHRQSQKGTWIKRVAPGTYSLVAQKATVAGAEVKDGKVAGVEVNPDPKPETRRRGRKEEAVPA